MAASTNPERPSRHRRVLRGALCVLLAALLLFSVTEPGRRFWYDVYRLAGFAPRIETPLRIHFLDVGKADAVVIECEGHAALADAGTFLAGEKISDYMERCHVPPLDYAIVSHPDADHLGGMEQVISEKGADLFVRSPYFPEKYEEIDRLLKKLSVPTREVRPGDTLTLGGATLRFLGPVRGHEDTNDTSLVFRLEYKGFTALFCGDVEEAGENDLIRAGADLSADLLKVAHHGSKTSTKKRFLQAVDPDYAVISTGEGTGDLPDEKTLIRLEELGADIYRTDIDGTVIFGWDGERIQIETEHYPERNVR